MSNPTNPLSSRRVADSQTTNVMWKRVCFFAFAVLASLLLVLSLKLPLWQMRLEAPQYRDREALRIAVHPNALHGDLRELSVLDQYIGVHVPAALPQFKWLPSLLVAAAVLGLAVGFVGNRFRSRGMVLISGGLTLALALAAIQAMAQIREISHNRDQKTVLVGVKEFAPPFLGTSKIAQFTVTSRFGLGAWLIGGALALQLTAAWLCKYPNSRRRTSESSGMGHPTPLMSSVSHQV
jgi:copper chaperone NosL